MKEKKLAKIFHAELWGLRENKYDWLSRHDIKNTKWKKLSPKSEFYLFIPREEALWESYEKFTKITEIFPVNSVGIVTSRDGFVIDSDKEKLKNRIRMFCNEKMSDEQVRCTFNLKDKSNWKLKDAQEKVREDKNWQDSIKRILYRPFDIQWVFYHDEVIERSRKEVMRHMLKENLGLVFHRREELLIPYTHFLVTTNIVEHGCLSSKTTCYLAPLYLYPEKDNPKKRSSGSTMMIFEPEAEYEAKKPNLHPSIVEQLTKAFKRQPSPEQIFFYIYAVLYSNTYRTKYAEFLKIDFPRIPFTYDYKLFSKMVKLGEGLVNLHLLKSAELDPPIVKFPVKGDDKVKKIRYNEDKVYINEEQYFEGLKSEVWQYQIGGYQVCNKWLKDRKGERVDIRHYCKIVTSLARTIEIQGAIDKVYPEIELSNAK